MAIKYLEVSAHMTSISIFVLNCRLRDKLNTFVLQTKTYKIIQEFGSSQKERKRSCLKRFQTQIKVRFETSLLYGLFFREKLSFNQGLKKFKCI